MGLQVKGRADLGHENTSEAGSLSVTFHGGQPEVHSGPLCGLLTDQISFEMNADGATTGEVTILSH